MDTNIYTSLILLAIYDKEINHHYLKRYIKFIRHFKAIEPQGKRPKGFERHHIFPKNYCSKQFAKDPNNLVLLPLRVHFIAHHLLYKAFPKNMAMTYAFKRLTENKKYKSRITGRLFEKLRNNFSEITSENNLKRVEEGTHNLLNKEKARENNLKRVANGTHPFLGGKIQRETSRATALKRVKNGTHIFLDSDFQRANNLKRVENKTHHFLETGKVNVFDLELGECVRITKEVYHSNRQRFLHPSSKKYKALKNLPLLTCPHCGKVCDSINYGRWHGAQCPQNPDNNKVKNVV